MDDLFIPSRMSTFIIIFMKTNNLWFKLKFVMMYSNSSQIELVWCRTQM